MGYVSAPVHLFLARHGRVTYYLWSLSLVGCVSGCVLSVFQTKTRYKFVNDSVIVELDELKAVPKKLVSRIKLGASFHKKTISLKKRPSLKLLLLFEIPFYWG